MLQKFKQLEERVQASAENQTEQKMMLHRTMACLQESKLVEIFFCFRLLCWFICLFACFSLSFMLGWFSGRPSRSALVCLETATKK